MTKPHFIRHVRYVTMAINTIRPISIYVRGVFDIVPCVEKLRRKNISEIKRFEIVRCVMSEVGRKLIESFKARFRAGNACSDGKMRAFVRGTIYFILKDLSCASSCFVSLFIMIKNFFEAFL